MTLAFALLLAAFGATVLWWESRRADPIGMYAGWFMLLAAVALVVPYAWFLTIGEAFS